MLDSLLGRKFSAKCKQSIKCIKTRICLIRKRKQATVNFLKKDVVDLLANGHDTNAIGRLMLEKERAMKVPPQQKMQRQATLSTEHNNEHKAALQRAVTLAVPDAYTSSYGTFDESSGGGGQNSTVPKKSRQETWHHLINRL